MPTDARAAWNDAHEAGVQWTEHMPADMGPQDLCIDALLGIGLRQPDAASPRTGTNERLLTVLRSLQSSNSPVLCADIASGLDADTGQYLPGFAPLNAPASARHTLALLTLQPGLFTG
ncbi:NAD(P)H-hydrate epimerase, partial [Escherichia coli]|uniref:NAD(P)H-hydrate epimerase n=1 Tax=Escherichia coli TaxID=562 RepID=UPI0022F13DBF